MNKKKENTKHYYGSLIFMIILIILTFFLLFKDNSLSALRPILKTADPIYLLIGLFFMIVFISCEALNIKMIMKSFDIRLSFKKCMNYAFIGFYFSAITPSASGGQPVQVYYMKRDHINVSHSSLTLLIVTVIFQIVMLLYGLFMYFFEYEFIMANVRGIKWLLLFGVVINLILIAFIFAAIFSKKIITKFILSIIKFLAKIRVVKNIDSTRENVLQQIDEYSNGARFIKKNPLLLIKVALVTIIQKTAVYSVPFFIYQSFHLSGHSLMQVLAIQALLTIAVSSLPLPGAVGVTETSFMTLFKIFFSSGLILPAMLLSRGISFYAMLIISGIVTLFVHIKSGKNVCKIPEKKVS